MTILSLDRLGETIQLVFLKLIFILFKSNITGTRQNHFDRLKIWDMGKTENLDKAYLKKELQVFVEKTKHLNQISKGDQAIFYLKKN
jgi:hypothetical protein